MKRIPKMLSTLKKLFNIGEITQVSPDVTDTAYRSISESELKSMMKETYVPDPTGTAQVNHLMIPTMLEPLGRELIDRRVDHEKLMSLAPEIEQAAAILIPSILAPNDFRKNVFEVVVKGGNESDAIKTEIVSLINTHFNDELELSVKISGWVHDAMFKMGGKAIMILPTATISKLRDAVGTTEMLGIEVNNLLRSIDGSIESIDIRTVTNAAYKDDDIIDKAFGTGVFNEALMTAPDYEASARQIRGVIKNGLPKGFSHIASRNPVVFSDDPRTLLKPKLSNSAALESIDSKILKSLGEDATPFHRDTRDGIAARANMTASTYTYHPYIDLSEFVVNDESSNFPAMIELPYESVIPVIIEGSPSNHIGYFVMVNVNGSPISAETDNFGDMMGSQSGSHRINNLYNAFYGSSQFSVQKKMSTDAKTAILTSIYDSFINNMMHSKLDKLGLDKYRVEISSDISKVMFTRLLKNAQTRIVFVPRKLMVYLAFQYNADGTGRSKIDNIKFPLSLKMTLIVTRLISLIESSINRRNLNVTLDEGIGNPLEILRSIKKDVMSNKLYGISYDPSTIIKSILDKQLTIIPNKIPGVEEFSLSDTANNVDYPRPDNAILEEITNMYMLSLGVPPSAMNRLNEDEFSRSVASNNIFFSNQLKTYQKDVCVFMTDLIVIYTRFSKKLMGSLRSILDETAAGGISGSVEAAKDDKPKDKRAKDPSKKAKDDKKSDKDSDEQITISTRLENVLNNIKFTLPSPTLAQDKSAFEELKDYVEIIDLVLSNMFPDDMTSDSDLSNLVKVMRSDAKRTILSEHIKANSLLSGLNFDMFDNVNVSGAVEVTQKLMNLKKALGDLMAKLNTDETGGTAPTSW